MGNQGGCERRTEVFVKIQKTIFFFFLGGGGVEGGGGGWGEGQGGCELRIEVFWKIQKKNGGGGVRGVGLGVRVDVNEELKFCDNSKKIWGGGSGGRWEGPVGGGVGWM